MRRRLLWRFIAGIGTGVEIVSIGVFGPTSEQLAHEGIPSH